jgi:epoxyqueuosine reductase
MLEGNSQIRNLSNQIKVKAADLGFDLCHIVPLSSAPHADFFEQWLQLGRAGEMGYLACNVEKRRQPRLLAEDSGDFRSIIVLAVNYHQFDLPPEVIDDPSRGIIASYAWGDDYHEIIRPLLYELDGFIRGQTGRATPGKALVDTGPVLERDWAQQAGIGFTGKNCCTIHPQLGSWLFLATLMTPEILDYDPAPRAVGVPDLDPMAVAAGLPGRADYGQWEIPLSSVKKTTDDRRRTTDVHTTDVLQPEVGWATGTCGRCTRCLDACPTDAFTGPFHLDPLRCISYWTIEAKEPIPRDLRVHFGNRIFGCDICQEVCPWNRRLPERTPLLEGLAAQTGRIAPPLLEGFQPETPYWLDIGAFAERFRRSPVKRAKRHGMLRNVCVALGNWADPVALPALQQALVDPEAVARGHAAWAIGQIVGLHGHPVARAALEARMHQESDQESDKWVRSEIAAALANS